MKKLAVFLTLIGLIAAVVAVDAYPAFRAWKRQQERILIDGDQIGSTLQGISARVEFAKAFATKASPDRTLLLVRLALNGETKSAAVWGDCSLSIRDESGQIWLPLFSAEASAAVRALTPDRQDNQPCRISRIGQSQQALSDQLFRLPSDKLDQLTLIISGPGTRPEALAIEVKPVLSLM